MEDNFAKNWHRYLIALIIFCNAWYAGLEFALAIGAQIKQGADAYYLFGFGITGLILGPLTQFPLAYGIFRTKRYGLYFAIAYLGALAFVGLYPLMIVSGALVIYTYFFCFDVDREIMKSGLKKLSQAWRFIRYSA